MSFERRDGADISPLVAGVKGALCLQVYGEIAHCFFCLVWVSSEKVDAERSVGGYYMFQCNFVGVAESCNDA